jgi:cystathionine beta-lyase/cystathionine gamma-synthase
MEVQDIPAVVRAAKARGVLVGCDNTWCTPLLFKPLDHGCDFAAEALTKYVGGHSDLLLGSITVKDIALRQRMKEVLRSLVLSGRVRQAWWPEAETPSTRQAVRMGQGPRHEQR